MTAIENQSIASVRHFEIQAVGKPANQTQGDSPQIVNSFTPKENHLSDKFSTLIQDINDDIKKGDAASATRHIEHATRFTQQNEKHHNEQKTQTKGNIYRVFDSEQGNASEGRQLANALERDELTTERLNQGIEHLTYSDDQKKQIKIDLGQSLESCNETRTILLKKAAELSQVVQKAKITLVNTNDVTAQALKKAALEFNKTVETLFNELHAYDELKQLQLDLKAIEQQTKQNDDPESLAQVLKSLYQFNTEYNECVHLVSKKAQQTQTKLNEYQILLQTNLASMSQLDQENRAHFTKKRQEELENLTSQNDTIISITAVLAEKLTQEKKTPRSPHKT